MPRPTPGRPDLGLGDPGGVWAGAPAPREIQEVKKGGHSLEACVLRLLVCACSACACWDRTLRPGRPHGHPAPWPLLPPGAGGARKESWVCPGFQRLGGRQVLPRKRWTDLLNGKAPRDPGPAHSPKGRRLPQGQGWCGGSMGAPPTRAPPVPKGRNSGEGWRAHRDGMTREEVDPDCHTMCLGPEPSPSLPSNTSPSC